MNALGKHTTPTWQRSRRRGIAGGIGSTVLLFALALSYVAPAGAARVQGRGPSISASRCAQNRAAGAITYVSPFGYDGSAGIIDVFAAQSLGYFKQLCISVNFVTNSFAAEELVSAGRGTTTSIGSAADTLTAMANGSHFTAVATYGDTSDYVLLTSPSITSLKQLAGKTLGVHPPTPVVLTEMLERAGVALSSVHEVTAGYDPNILPEGKVQALQAYRTNEPLTLSEEHAAYREWLPSAFGVVGTFNVVVINTTFLHDHYSTASDFLRAELHGFSYCAAHVNACVAIEDKAALSAKQSYDVAHATAEWTLESKLALDNTLSKKGVGVESIAEWQPEANAVLKVGVVKSVPALSSVENTTMAAALYRGKSLIWPGP